MISIKNLHVGSVYYDINEDSVIRIEAIGKKEKRIIFKLIKMGHNSSEIWHMNETYKEFRLRKLLNVEIDIKNETYH